MPADFGNLWNFIVPLTIGRYVLRASAGSKVIRLDNGNIEIVADDDPRLATQYFGELAYDFDSERDDGSNVNITIVGRTP